MGNTASFFKSFDTFGARIPSFSLGGRVKVKTWSGAIASMIIFILTLMFCLYKFRNVFERRNPTVNNYTTALAD